MRYDLPNQDLLLSASGLRQVCVMSVSEVWVTLATKVCVKVRQRSALVCVTMVSYTLYTLTPKYSTSQYRYIIHIYTLLLAASTLCVNLRDHKTPWPAAAGIEKVTVSS